MITNQTTLDSLQEAVKKKTKLFLSAEGVDVVFQTYIVAIEDQQLVLANKVPPEHISQVVDAVRYSLQLQMIRLETHEISSDGVHILFPLSKLNEIADNRGAKRFFFDHESVVIEFLNPYDEETVIRKPAIEMSTTGISVKSKVKSKLYTPGTKFSGIKILVDGEIYSQADGEVVYNRKFLDLEGRYFYQIGFRFDSPVPSQET